MSDHECPVCYLTEEVDPKCTMCKGAGRVSAEDLADYRSGEKHAEETLARDPDMQLFIKITAACLGRPE